jgi:hypothetical protein
VAASLPIQLFRFSERRFAEALTRDGSVRIKTLYECQKAEAAGPGRFDPDENGKRMQQFVPFAVTNEYDRWPALMKEMLRRPPAASDHAPSVFINSTFERYFEGPDLYVFCVARRARIENRKSVPIRARRRHVGRDTQSTRLLQCDVPSDC